MKIHSTTVASNGEGLVVVCNQCKQLPGVYFTPKKAEKAATSHKNQYNEIEDDVKGVRNEIEKIAKSSTSFDEFQNKVLNDKKLRKIAGFRGLQQMIQHSKAGMLLD